MSNNIRIKVTNNVSIPNAPDNIRQFYTRYNYSDRQVNLYGHNDNPNEISASFKPDVPISHYAWNIAYTYNALGLTMPQFISSDQWESTTQYAASGFVTAVNSFMPKLFTPTKILTQNGVYTTGHQDNVAICTIPNDGGTGDWFNKQVFNWHIDQVLGEPPDEENIQKFSVDRANGFITFNGKSDTTADLETIVTLIDGDEIPVGSWYPNDKLVGQGAFCLVLNVNHTYPARGTQEEKQKQWVIDFEFGEVVASLTQAGLTVTLNSDTTTKVQLSQSASKEVPPQANALKDAYFIIFYPVWNGIVIANGIQDTRNTINISQQFLIKSKDVSINDYNVMHHGRINYGGSDDYPDNDDLPNNWGPFDPDNPSDIFIAVNDKTHVSFGDSLEVRSKNCTYSVAYVPLFHSPGAFVDTFFESNIDQESGTGENYSYKYYGYKSWPIWTDNNAHYQIQDRIYGRNDDGSYNLPIDSETAWRWNRERFRIFESELDPVPMRRAGELFGFLLRAIEKSNVTTIAENGSFDFDATNKVDYPAGNPENDKHWSRFIKSISVTIGLDDSSGQVVVDKYGLFGQDATPEQIIGAIKLKVTNSPNDSFFSPPAGYDSVDDDGVIFTGLAMGISDTQSTSGSDCTIPLVSFQKKMEDIVLINVPFFDGMNLVKKETINESGVRNYDTVEMDGVFVYLCKYAGINYNISNANENAILPASDDITAPLIDWKSGTSVQDAMTSTMEFTAHQYYFDASGTCRLYELENDGLPPVSSLGPDWKPYYPDTKIMSVDRTPDFEDIRNEMIVIGLKQTKSRNRQNETEETEPDIFPHLWYKNTRPTNPDFPWSKSIVQNIPGFVTQEKLDDIADKLTKLTRIYELVGRTQISGNASIKPYDKWGDFIITSVTHNLDFESKIWTTDLEFASGKLGE